MFLEILSVEAFTEKYLYLEGLSDVAKATSKSFHSAPIFDMSLLAADVPDTTSPFAESFAAEKLKTYAVLGLRGIGLL